MTSETSGGTGIYRHIVAPPFRVRLLRGTLNSQRPSTWLISRLERLCIPAYQPVYVAVALNSLIGRMQTRRAVTGSAQVHLYPNDIMNFVVPFVEGGVQQAIEKAVEQAHVASRRAKQLLEAAKRAVEVAVEKDEAAGLAVLARAEGGGNA